MDAKLIEYLGDLGVPDALRERVANLVGSYEALIEDPIGAWFVSDYIDDQDQRVFESLWLFTEHLMMQAQLLGEDEDQFDFVPFKSRVRQVAVAKRAFDFPDATASSRMTVETWLEDRRYSVMRATGVNCVALFDIVQTVLLPNADGASEG